MSRILAACVVGMGFAAVTLAAGQNPPAPKPAIGTGVIAGRVVEAGSQTPVPETIVNLLGPMNLARPELGVGERRRVMVDPQGRFAFGGLPAGTYRVSANQFGYLFGGFGMTRPSGDLSPIELTDGQHFTDATISMWRLGSISGRVVDEAGEPIVGVRTVVLQRTIRNGQVVLAPAVLNGGLISSSFTTDDRGVYRASMLPPGDYAIAVPATVSTFPVDIVRDALTSKIDLGVSETAPLGDSRNLQIGNQILMTTSRAPIPPARDGVPVTVYEMTFHPGATTAEEATVLSLRAGENRSGIDIRFVAKPTVRVSGKIVGPDGALPLTSFRLLRAGATPVTDAYGFEAATGITDARGQFTLLGVPRGSYVLRVQTSQPATTPGARATPISVDHPFAVGDADVADVLVTARPGATISGRVEFRGTPAIPPDQLDLSIGGPDRGYEVRVDRDYRFAMAVPPGRYLVFLYRASGGCVSTSGGKVISDDLLDVRDQNITDILIVCDATTTRITGTVRDDRGQLDPHAQVVIFSTERRFWSGPEFRKRRAATERVTPGAHFDISDLPPGEYFAAAIPEALADTWEYPAFREALVPSAVRITIAAGETRALDLRTSVIR